MPYVTLFLAGLLAATFTSWETTLIVAIAACFLGMLAVNVMFRVRVLKAYKELQRAGIDFDASDMLNRDRIDQLVQRFPQQEQAIRRFTGWALDVVCRWLAA